jgi:hypothetical protein
MCTRGIYESVATFCDFTEAIVPLAEAFEFQSIADLIQARAFQTRIPSFLEKNDTSIRAPQILNQIDAMNRHYAGYREAYDHLSDLVHPNGLGVVVYFSQRNDGVVTFSDGGYPAERARTSLICAAFMLMFFELALHRLDAALEKLSAEAARRSAERSLWEHAPPGTTGI